MRLGVDSGYFLTKSSKGVAYNSGLKEHNAIPVAADNRVIYDNRFFSVGEKRDAMDMDKTSNEDMLIQMLPLVGHAMVSKKLNLEEKVKLELGVGTPLKEYGEKMAAYRDYFLGKDLEFVWNDYVCKAEIVRTEVYPQGYASYLSNWEEYGKYQELNVFDFGGGTVDAFRISEGMPVTDTFVSLHSGVIKLVNRIRDELEPKSIFISENQICNAVMKKEILYAEAEMISKISETESHEYVKNVLRQLRERDFDLRVPTLIIGGGAALIMDILKEHSINISGCLDVFANAKAYEALLDRD